MSFPQARERMTNAVFARLGEDAEWAGVADPVRVILTQQDETLRFDRAVQRQMGQMLRVRRAEVAAPALGDVVTLQHDSSQWAVIAEPELLRHGVWQCEISPA